VTDLELITKQELAELFRVPVTWVDEMVAARRIPFTRLGKRQIRFSRTDVQAIHTAGREPAMNP
jgi:excisionase family DNA binding protein